MSRAEIDSPANWFGSEIEKRADWIHHFGKDEVDEIEKALSSVRARGIGIVEVNRERFAAAIRLSPGKSCSRASRNSARLGAPS